jgi:hypothetical protein
MQSDILLYRIARIGDPAKLGRDCEIHQHKYSFIIWYIRMIVVIDIILILMFYNAISLSRRFPDAWAHGFRLSNMSGRTCHAVTTARLGTRVQAGPC